LAARAAALEPERFLVLASRRRSERRLIVEILAARRTAVEYHPSHCSDD
jgi:hypothetical protein